MGTALASTAGKDRQILARPMRRSAGSTTGELPRGTAIVLLSAFAPPTVGGIATVLSALIPEFRRHDLAIILVAPTAPPATPDRAGIHWVISSHLAAGRRAWQRYMAGEVPGWEEVIAEMRDAGNGLADELRALAPALIHSHSDWFIAGVAAHRLGRPHIATLHGYPPNPEDFAAEGLTYNPKIDKVREQVRRMNYTALTAVSEFVKGRWAGAGIPADRITVVGNPVRFDLFRPQPGDVRERTRRELGVALAARLICSPQRPERFGMSTLLAAFGAFWQERRDAVLLLCGCTELPAALQRQAVDLGIGHAIVARSFPLEQMASVYAASDAVTLPTPVESFGLPALEALAVGTPVVACDAGAYRELLREGHGALLFRPGAVEHLCAQLAAALAPDFRRCPGPTIARAERRRFSADVVAAQYLKVFSDAVGAP